MSSLNQESHKSWQRTIKILEAIKQELEAMEAFEALGAPPEPSTAKGRAEWAAFKIEAMGQSRAAMLGLAMVLPNQANKHNIKEAKEHLFSMADARREPFVLDWLAERGVSMREMRRPLKERGGLSWMELLLLEQWE